MTRKICGRAREPGHETEQEQRPESLHRTAQWVPHGARSTVWYWYYTPWTVGMASGLHSCAGHSASSLGLLHFILCTTARVVFKKYNSYHFSLPVASPSMWMNRPMDTSCSHLRAFALVAIPSAWDSLPQGGQFLPITQVSAPMSRSQKRGLFWSPSCHAPPVTRTACTVAAFTWNVVHLFVYTLGSFLSFRISFL